MKTLNSLLFLITYVLFELDQVSSYDPLLVFENTLTGKVRLPYKAEQLEDGKIIYPEVGQDGQSDLYLCHPQSTEMKQYIANNSQWDDDDYCLINYTTTSSSQDTPTIPTCLSEIQPLFTNRLKKELYSTSQDCGTSVDHTLHQFGFNYCTISTNPLAFTLIQSQLLSIYDICFDTHKSKPVWTKHQVRTGFMLKGAGLSSQSIENEVALSTEAFRSKFTSRSEKTFEKQANEYKEQGPAPLHTMIPQMLVPHEDIAIKLWKKTTTHYLNTALLWEKLVPVMKSINNGIRRAAIAVNLKSFNEKPITSDNLDIYTTTYSHLSTLKQILSKVHFVQKPFGWNIWCKFVHHSSRNQGIMIFLHNLPGNPPASKNPTTYYSQGEQSSKQTEPGGNSNKLAQPLIGKETDDLKTEKLLKDKECEKTIPCKFEKWLTNQSNQDFSPDLFSYAYCCEVNITKVEELFGIKLENEVELLSIDDIIASSLESS